MEVHRAPVHYPYPHSHHYRSDSSHSASYRPVYQPYPAQSYYSSPPQPPRPQPEPVKLPGISDLLRFARDEPAPAPAARPDPSWPRTAPAPSLKVETANIDPRLHRPISPPSSAAASVRPAPRSPAYSVVSGAATASAYPPVYPDDRAVSVSSEQSKRLSLQSAQSVASSHSSHSAGYPSPETAKSAISMYPPVPHAGSSPAGLANQRPLPQDFPGPQTTAASPRQPAHHHSSSASSDAMYIDSRAPHSYHLSPTAAVSSGPAATAPVQSSPGPASNPSQDRYVCQSCNKAFSRPSSLRIHSHSHTGEKPFRCPRKGCGKAFSVRSNMKRHERGCHVNGEHGPRGASPRSLSGED